MKAQTTATAAPRQFPAELPATSTQAIVSQQPQNSLWSEECGAELIEVAFAVPLLMAIVFGLIQVCLVLYTGQYIAELAREGSRYGSMHGANCVNSYTSASCTVTAAQIATYVTSNRLPNLAGGNVSVDTTAADIFPDGDQVSPHRVQVKVIYAFPYRIPFAKNSTLTITSTSTMTIVQ